MSGAEFVKEAAKERVHFWKELIRLKSRATNWEWAIENEMWEYLRASAREVADMAEKLSEYSRMDAVAKDLWKKSMRETGKEVE